MNTVHIKIATFGTPYDYAHLDGHFALGVDKEAVRVGRSRVAAVQLLTPRLHLINVAFVLRGARRAVFLRNLLRFKHPEREPMNRNLITYQYRENMLQIRFIK
jgi:hypothetical protein